LNRGQLLRHHPRKVSEHLKIFLVELVRLVVDDAQGSEVCVAHFQRTPGIKTNVGVANHQRVVRKALIASRVGNYEDVVSKDGMGAERYIARSFREPTRRFST